jgi:hypothetical protein
MRKLTEKEYVNVLRMQAGSETKLSELDYINILRSSAGSGNSVTILCVNDDPPPDQAIECNGDWTDWEIKRFEGMTLRVCLINAVAEKLKFDQARCLRMHIPWQNPLEGNWLVEQLSLPKVKLKGQYRAKIFSTQRLRTKWHVDNVIARNRRVSGDLYNGERLVKHGFNVKLTGNKFSVGLAGGSGFKITFKL